MKSDYQKALEEFRIWKRKFAHVLQHSDLDGYAIDLDSDLEGSMDKLDDEPARRSDFDEHNIWNKAQTGVV